VIGSYFLNEGQARTLLVSLAARIDAVLPAFGLVPAGDPTILMQQRPELFAEELVIRVPVRRREAV
jgi:hypothetical protein